MQLELSLPAAYASVAAVAGGTTTSCSIATYAPACCVQQRVSAQPSIYLSMVECGLRAQSVCEFCTGEGLIPLGNRGCVHGLVHGLVALAKLRAAVAVLSGYECTG